MVRLLESHWVTPNRTQWICSNNLWPWLPPGWIGRCTLGLPQTQGHIHNNLKDDPNQSTIGTIPTGQEICIPLV